MTDETNKLAKHKLAREKLRTSEIRYRRLFEAAPDGILILDAATRRITDINPYMVELLGFSRDEILGKELWEIGLLRDVQASQEAFRELERTGYIRYDDLPLQTREGPSREVEFVSNVYGEEDGHQVIQCNIRDLSARKLEQHSLRKANDELMALLAEYESRDAEMQLLNRMNDQLQTCN